MNSRQAEWLWPTDQCILPIHHFLLCSWDQLLPLHLDPSFLCPRIRYRNDEEVALRRARVKAPSNSSFKDSHWMCRCSGFVLTRICCSSRAVWWTSTQKATMANQRWREILPQLMLSTGSLTFTATSSLQILPPVADPSLPFPVMWNTPFTLSQV
jgi:hypothetical protein